MSQSGKTYPAAGRNVFADPSDVATRLAPCACAACRMERAEKVAPVMPPFVKDGPDDGCFVGGGS